MKCKYKYAMWTLVFILLSGIVLLIPYAYFIIQDNNLIEKEKLIAMEPIEKQWNEVESNFSLEEKIEMLKSKGDIVTVNLETGNLLSLYEARKSCFNELCKIPSLQMDIYGPVKDEIFITPKLYIDVDTPSHTMIVWSGTLTINKVVFEVTIEEESNKILFIQVIEGEVNEEFKPKLQEEWISYLSQN